MHDPAVFTESLPSARNGWSVLNLTGQNGEGSRDKCCAGHTKARKGEIGCKGQGREAIFSKLVRKPHEKMTFEQGVEGTKEVSQVDTWKNLPQWQGFFSLFWSQLSPEGPEQ